MAEVSPKELHINVLYMCTSKDLYVEVESPRQVVNQ